ncbi:aldose epimerase family protein [Aestuariibacter sp. A3R04]|uniref:aldose epimerase family protein n=1 Tax=Aestuariibacter sp. A3R04 TaxID=2841571 RepID=UPI001C0803A7|nr:aldose epimerase family protein [Aestuariibacter sp. A3R04]MBU3020618.1 galactose mutarotase [Aestuariibacter sp. A3R04]
MNIQKRLFGEADGKAVYLYRLSNGKGIDVEILTFGGIIHSLQVPDSSGALHQCVQQYSSLEGYISDPSYRGALVGRYANRIGKGQFSLDGITYHLDQNGGEHCLHGGEQGFHKKVWQAEEVSSGNAAGIRLTHTSADGESGFPGNVNVEATYWLDENNDLTLTLHATTDKATPFSMTQHAYFTLSRDPSVKSTTLYLNADAITEVDSSLCPTGKTIAVANTPFDFRTPSKIASRCTGTHPLFDAVGGYDHNFILTASSSSDKPAAQASADDTGIVMSLYTDLPGLQCYTGNLQGEEQLGAFCLEPQHFPDAPNQEDFPSPIITPHKPYKAVIRYHFEVAK